MAGALSDKSILITGAASGIGKAAAELFAREGALLALCDQSPGGEAVAGAIRAAGGKAIFQRMDVTSSAEVEAGVAAAVAAYGRLDGAFNNAGVSRHGQPLARGEEDEFDRVMAINVKGVWLCLKHEINAMLAGKVKGAIVNTASVAGVIAAPRMEAYGASKHAVIGLTKTAAIEYAKAGIRVNAVCPGIIRTPMMEQVSQGDAEREAGLAATHPLGRVGEPEEIAQAAMWLLSDAASFVTGHQLLVDGGMTAI